MLDMGRKFMVGVGVYSFNYYHFSNFRQKKSDCVWIERRRRRRTILTEKGRFAKEAKVK